jgi:hypothetical protein
MEGIANYGIQKLITCRDLATWTIDVKLQAGFAAVVGVLQV